MTCVDFIQVITLTFLEGIDVQSCMINIAVDLQITDHMITDPMQTEIIDKVCVVGGKSSFHYSSDSYFKETSICRGSYAKVCAKEYIIM